MPATQPAALLVQRKADRTSYLCEAAPDGPVRTLRKIGQYHTEFSVTRWHGLPTSANGLAITLRSGPFDVQVSITATEAREIAAALTQAALEHDLAQAEARREAA